MFHILICFVPIKELDLYVSTVMEDLFVFIKDRDLNGLNVKAYQFVSTKKEDLTVLMVKVVRFVITLRANFFAALLFGGFFGPAEFANSMNNKAILMFKGANSLFWNLWM